jgi:hypothetical protein
VGEGEELMTQAFQINASRSTARDGFFSSRSLASATAPARALPSLRHGTQAYFWTPEWQQRERLADYDFLIGDTYEPTDVADLIRELDSGDE